MYVFGQKVLEAGENGTAGAEGAQRSVIADVLAVFVEGVDDRGSRPR
jgi:hypothetical protein